MSDKAKQSFIEVLLQTSIAQISACHLAFIQQRASDAKYKLFIISYLLSCPSAQTRFMFWKQKRFPFESQRQALQNFT